jgi:formate hydrogenlyase subunit 4
MEGLTRKAGGQPFGWRSLRFAPVRKPPLANTFFHYLEPPLQLALAVMVCLILPIAHFAPPTHGLDHFFLFAALLFFPLWIHYLTAARSQNEWRIIMSEAKLKKMLWTAGPLALAFLTLSQKYRTTSIYNLVSVQGFMPWDWNIFQSVEGFVAGVIFLLCVLSINNVAPFHTHHIFPKESEWLDRNGADGDLLKICACGNQMLWIICFVNLFLGGTNIQLYFAPVSQGMVMIFSGCVLVFLKAMALAFAFTIIDSRLSSLAPQRCARLFLRKLTPLSLGLFILPILAKWGPSLWKA